MSRFVAGLIIWRDDMDIFLLRHAEAEPLGESNQFRDDSRALTGEGRKQMKNAALGLQALDIHFDLIASSPLIRARETAEIVAEIGKSGKPIDIWDELSPGVKPAALYERIKACGRVNSILLVGHEPDMGIIASHLLVGSGKVSIPFKKAGLCRIAVDAFPPTLPGNLKWMLTPKILARLRLGL
jgi:phosphohistidine phosphatase